MISPIRNKVILRPIFDKMSQSIAIPEDFSQCQSGEVVSVSKDFKLPVKVGDRVMFHPNAAWTNIEHEGETLRIMNHHDLLAVME